MANAGRWDPWYAEATEQRAYDSGDDTTYRMAAEWLDGLSVEDWGAGLGWFKTVHRGPYTAVDGSWSRWCDVQADLVLYRSDTPGLLLRHVLEHNHEWQVVLENAIASFTQRMCIVLFTPLAEATHIIAEDVGGLGVPDISFALADITGPLEEYEYSVETVDTGCAYGAETFIRVGGRLEPAQRHSVPRP